MGINDHIEFGAVLASDIISAMQLPGGGTLTAFAQKYVAKKRQEAAEIFMNEIASGHHGPIDFDAHDIDPLIDIIYRFSKAVETGAAKENLRLLAQIIAGLKKYKALDSDKFLKWCGIIEGLTRSELLVIGFGYSIRKRIDSNQPNAANDFWQQLQGALQNASFNNAEIDALCASLSRTGVIVPVSAFDGMAYMDTPWLKELGELANLHSSETGTTK